MYRHGTVAPQGSPLLGNCVLLPGDRYLAPIDVKMCMLIQLCPVPDSVSGMILFCDLLFFCLYMTVFFIFYSKLQFCRAYFYSASLGGVKLPFVSCYNYISLRQSFVRSICEQDNLRMR